MTQRSRDFESHRWFAFAVICAGAFACAVEDSPSVGLELDRLDAQVGVGIGKVERALHDRSRTFAALGEGASLVETSVRQLSALERDVRASDAQRLTAVLLQARAYDDLALALGDVGALAELPPEQRVILGEILQEKAIPARVGARERFQQARALACRLGLAEHETMAEILDGMNRYGARMSGRLASCE